MPKAPAYKPGRTTEYQLVQGFTRGYRNREDVTTLPNDVMVVGSQNVLTNTFKRIGARKGFTLDGQRTVSKVSATGYFEVTDYTQVMSGGADEGKTLTIGGISLTFGTDINVVGLVSNASLALRIVNAINASAINTPFSVTGAHAEVGAGPDHTPEQAVIIANVQGESGNLIDTSTTANATMFALGPFLGGGLNQALANPILAAYDWMRHTGDERHLRAGFDANGGAGKLQFRWVASAGQKYKDQTFTEGEVYWLDILDNLTSSRFNFANFFYSTELKSMLLMVNGTGLIYEWTGGVAEVQSNTSNTLTKSGTKTWAEEGFIFGATFLSGAPYVLIDGVSYFYQSGGNTTTLSDFTPALPAITPKTLVIQKPSVHTTGGSFYPGLPAAMKKDLIEVLNQQIYIGDKNRNDVYISRQDQFSFDTTVNPGSPGCARVLTLDGPPRGFIPENQSMFISSGRDNWHKISFTLSADLTKEAVNPTRLKTTFGQGAQSQALMTKIKNNIAFVSYEPIVNVFGTAQNYLDDPQTQDISYPIVEDMNAYDFSDGFIRFFRKYIYLTIPHSSVIRVYNMTNDFSDQADISPSQNHYWEAPLTMPMGPLSFVDGKIIGHSSQDSNSYILFDGGSDDGHPIEAKAVFAYENYDERNLLKDDNATYVEAYMTKNTKLTLGIQRAIGQSPEEYVIDGSDEQIVPPLTDDSSLGKNPLGKVPLGSSLNPADEFIGTNTNLPKVRVYKTYPRSPWFERQMSFRSLGVDQTWELLAFGSSVQLASGLPTQIFE